jgi:hypothetical protein
LSSKKLLSKAKDLGVNMRGGGNRTAPIEDIETITALGLLDAYNDLRKATNGRKVSFMIYKDSSIVTSKKDSFGIKF